MTDGHWVLLARVKNTYPHVPVLGPHGPVVVEGLERLGEAVLIHYPARLHAIGPAAIAEDQRCLDANHGAAHGCRELDGPAGAGGLPVAGSGGTVRSEAVCEVRGFGAEEVPPVPAGNRLGCRNGSYRP